MRILPLVLVAALSLSWLFLPSLHAQEWTRFRGPNGTGECEAHLPGTWTDADYLWKIDLPGIGHSSPAIWKDKLFVLSANPADATRHVLCYAANNGQQLWRRDYATKSHHLHARSSYASCSPTVDADHVYFAWSDPDHTWLRAFDHDGKEKWTADFGPWVSQHGFGSSPMLYGDLVIVNCSQEPSKLKDTPEPRDSFVVAVDRKTGEVRWKTPRKIDTTSYSVPCLRRRGDGQDEIVLCTTAEGFFGLDPATGRENWAAKVFDKRTVSSPFMVGDLLFGTTGSGGGGNYVVALKPEGPKPEVVYEVRKEAAPYVPAPVARGELLFLFSDKGIVTCVDTKTGQQHWQKRVNAAFSGSPIRAHDKLYCIAEDGHVIVIAAEKEFRELGRVPLGEDSRSTPAVSNGRLFLRTYSHLFAVGGEKT